MTGIDGQKRWWALYVLCAGVLMIVLDTTIVNVALPSIREDLQFTETSLVWVVNAYMLTFGGFLLLGGRLGDLFGHWSARSLQRSRACSAPRYCVRARMRLRRRTKRASGPSSRRRSLDRSTHGDVRTDPRVMGNLEFSKLQALWTRTADAL